MASEPGERTIAIHILPNTSRSKDNRAIKFGQLIEYNMRTIFLEIIRKMWWRKYSKVLF